MVVAAMASAPAIGNALSEAMGSMSPCLSSTPAGLPLLAPAVRPGESPACAARMNGRFEPEAAECPAIEQRDGPCTIADAGSSAGWRRPSAGSCSGACRALQLIATRLQEKPGAVAGSGPVRPDRGGAHVAGLWPPGGASAQGPPDLSRQPGSGLAQTCLVAARSQRPILVPIDRTEPASASTVWMMRLQRGGGSCRPLTFCRRR